MNELITNISAKEWLFALIVAIVVTTSSSVITYLIKHRFEKRKAKRDYLLPIFSEFTDVIIFEKTDLDYNNKCLPDWIKYLNYTIFKIAEITKYLDKFDIALDLYKTKYKDMWDELMKQSMRTSEELIKDIKNKEVVPNDTKKSIYNLVDETIELSQNTSNYILNRIRKYV